MPCRLNFAACGPKPAPRPALVPGRRGPFRRRRSVETTIVRPAEGSAANATTLRPADRTGDAADASTEGRPDPSDSCGAVRHSAAVPGRIRPERTKATVMRPAEASATGATTVRSVEWSGGAAKASIEGRPGPSVSIEAVRRSPPPEA